MDERRSVEAITRDIVVLLTELVTLTSESPPLEPTHPPTREAP